MIQELNADTISDLDEGRVRLMINAALAQILNDVEDRSQDGKARSLLLKLDFLRDHGNLLIEAQVATKLPPYVGNRTISKVKGRAKANGTAEYVALFQEYDAENPDQDTTIFDEPPQQPPTRKE